MQPLLNRSFLWREKAVTVARRGNKVTRSFLLLLRDTTWHPSLDCQSDFTSSLWWTADGVFNQSSRLARYPSTPQPSRISSIPSVAPFIYTIIPISTMNWTEGNLARHSRNRKHKDEFLRQREHFAKVRSGLQNPKTNVSPPSIALFAQAPFSISHASPRIPKTVTPNPSRKRPREVVSADTSQYFTNINVELPNPATFQKERAEEEGLRRKRQKLLMKRDWVGTDLQKPIQMEFPKPRTLLENPWSSSRPNRHSSKQRFRHLLGLKANNDQAAAAKDIIDKPVAESRSRLKVRVGAREKVLGGSSSISPHSRSYRDADTSSNGMINIP